MISLNIDFDTSVNNMQHWKGTRDKAEANMTKVCITNDETSCWILKGVSITRRNNYIILSIPLVLHLPYMQMSSLLMPQPLASFVFLHGFIGMNIFRGGVVSPTPNFPPRRTGTKLRLIPTLWPIWIGCLYKKLTLLSAKLSGPLGRTNVLSIIML
jgi:hypothetical protein